MKMRRLAPWLAAATVVLAAFVLAGTGSTWAQRGPIKIGMFVPLTGPLAANGKEMVNGLTLFLDEQGKRLAGREVQLLVEDSEGKPATALTKVRALVESQGVHMLVGPLSTAEAYAVL